MTQDIHLNQQQTIDGAGQESREPLSGEPIRDGLTGTDLSAAPSPVVDAPQPIVALLDAIPPEDEDPDPDWDEFDRQSRAPRARARPEDFHRAHARPDGRVSAKKSISRKTRISGSMATTFEANEIFISIQNVDGVHTHIRNSEQFTGQQKDCPLCENGSEFEKSFGRIGA